MKLEDKIGVSLLIVSLLAFIIMLFMNYSLKNKIEEKQNKESSIVSELQKIRLKYTDTNTYRHHQ